MIDVARYLVEQNRNWAISDIRNLRKMSFLTGNLSTFEVEPWFLREKNATIPCKFYLYPKDYELKMLQNS
jgi:hypothetical protein